MSSYLMVTRIYAEKLLKNWFFLLKNIFDSENLNSLLSETQ